MKHRFDGWFTERLPSGNIRHRVRVEGRKSVKITIPVGPEHPDFLNHYWAARAGQRYAPEAKPQAPARSFRWLCDAYLAHLAAQVDAGLKSPSTLKARRSQLHRLCDMKDKDGDPYGSLDMDMPPEAFVKARNAMMKTPAEADNTMKAVRAVYRFGIETEGLTVNPAIGVAKIHVSRGGAKPWTTDDLKAYRKRHPPGTTAHLYLTLLMFTACRIGDARILGRRHEIEASGMTWLRWQPGKKGSAEVELPILPPLLRATRAMKVQGETYILNERGQPFRNVETLRTRVRRWCDQAGLTERSSHGVRKAVAGLLAELGCTDHQIMAILSHTKPATTAIYTKGAQRRILSADAMSALAALDW